MGSMDRLGPSPSDLNRRHKFWVAATIWWATLVTVIYLPIPILAIGMAFGDAQPGTKSFIAYIAGITGGSTLLAIPEFYLFRPFSQMFR